MFEGAAVASERGNEKVLSLNSCVFRDFLKPALLCKNIFYPEAIGSILIIKKRGKKIRGIV